LIEIRPLSREEIYRIAEIDVSEQGDRIYRQVNGALATQPETWRRPPWSIEECQRRAAALVIQMERGDTVLGAFDGDRLVGEASLRYRLTGDTAQLVSLHVSQSHRRCGVAAALVREIFRLAQASGAQWIYVSATPSDSAVGFYLSKGFELVEQVNEELYALEPEDIHMIKALD
jgi:ribosomal protein S18 acetylase RimI-like enzyme